MARAWDTWSVEEQVKRRDASITRQFADIVGPFSPYYRQQLQILGLKASEITSLAALQRLPATGERDVCPDGDPAGAAALVCRADETGWALHAPGNRLRRTLLSGLLHRGRFRQQVEEAVRPTTYHLGGLGMSFPVASTRGDLDLMARAGARLWKVLGLTPDDVLVSALPTGPQLATRALDLAALAAGAPALSPGDSAEALQEALAILPATVLALPVASAAALLAELDDLPPTVSTLLLVGGPTPAQREELAAVSGGRRVLGVWGPPDGRVLYGEQTPGGGYVTYPDLEVLELADPDTGAPTGGREGGELLVTQLGFHGSALVRWRTGTIVDGPLLTDTATGRTAPRIPSNLSPGSLVPSVVLAEGPRALDLRALSGVLAARNDLAAFRVDLQRSERFGTDQVVIAIAPRGDADPAQVATGVARDARRATGTRVTQVVVEESLGDAPASVG